MDFKLTPCEEKLVLPHSKNSVTIGLPAEDGVGDTRVPLTPQGVEILVAQGHRVLAQRGLGIAARFSDESYANAGAEIVDSADAAFKADIVVKVSPPSEGQSELVRKGQTFVCLINRNVADVRAFRRLAEKKVTLVAADVMTDGESSEPVMSRSLGEVEGALAVTTAAHLLEQSDGGKGVIIGGVTGVPPTEVAIIGADTAAISAARAAAALGANVKVFDTSHSLLQKLEWKMSSHVFTSVLHPQALTKALKSADVIIGTRHANSGRQYFCVPAGYLSLLKHGAVIIDLDIVAGGRTELSLPTTVDEPVLRSRGLFFHCLPDITALVPHTASIIISDIISPALSQIATDGGVENAARLNPSVASSIAIFRGTVTNKDLSVRTGLEYVDARLLLI